MIPALLTMFLLLGSAYGTTRRTDSGLQLPIGHIYFYGYAGLNPGQVEARLPVHSGEVLDPNTFDREAKLIRKAVITATGKPATDVAAVCCDIDHHLLIYIGLTGDSSRKLPIRKAPLGTDHLSKSAMQLYQRDKGALEKAVERGNAGEDDSRGYALSDAPAAHSIQLEMRTYAVNRGPELEQVLRNSADSKQRQASACLLGYARRSGAQIRALMAASLDPDAGVRNDAVRALAVVLSSHDQMPANLDITPLISLLWSGKWTDRNKASFALATMTRDRNPGMLKQLRETAMPPLLEGASWDRDHSNSFLQILGRIGEIPKPELQKDLLAHDSAAIISAAERTQ